MSRKGSGGILLVGFAIAIVIFLLGGYVTQVSITAKSGTHSEFVDTVSYINSVVSMASRMAASAEAKLQYLDDLMVDFQERLEECNIQLEYIPAVTTEYVSVYYMMSKGETYFSGSPSDILNMGTGIGMGGGGYDGDTDGCSPTGPLCAGFYEEGTGSFDVQGTLSFTAQSGFDIEYYYPSSGEHGWLHVNAGDTVELVFDLWYVRCDIEVHPETGQVTVWTEWMAGTNAYTSLKVNGADAFATVPQGLRFDTTGVAGTVVLDANAYTTLGWGGGDIQVPDLGLWVEHYSWEDPTPWVVNLMDIEDGIISVLIRDKDTTERLWIMGYVGTVQIDEDVYP